MDTNCICKHAQTRHAAMGCKDCLCLMYQANNSGSLRGKEAWLFRGGEIIHGTVYGQDAANGLIYLETDGGQTFTLRFNEVDFTPQQVKQRIAKAVKRLGRMAAQFDHQFQPTEAR